MTKLRLSMASLPYDRVHALTSGEVQIEGVELTPLIMRWPLEIFSRMVRHGEFDIAEMSLTQCFVLRTLGRARFVPLPIFTSRMFRHGYIFINRNAGIRSPKDLKGKRIGLQGYQATAIVWMRGLLQEEYGVSFADVHWFEGGVNQPGVPGGDATSLSPDKPVRIVVRKRDARHVFREVWTLAVDPADKFIERGANQLALGPTRPPGGDGQPRGQEAPLPPELAPGNTAPQSPAECTR